MYYIIYRVCKETWLYLPRPMSLQRIFSCFRRKLSIFEESNVANTLVRLNSGMASVTQFLKFPIFRRSHVLKNAKFSRNSRFSGVPILSEPVQFVKSKINIGFLYIFYIPKIVSFRLKQACGCRISLPTLRYITWFY